VFAHLHCHFSGSYSDSVLSPEKDLDYLVETGHRAVALTDHGELAAVPRFARECRRRGLHPVIGCEFYFVENARESRERNDPSRFHLILLARNREGFQNLVAINNAAWLENSFRGVRGLVDWEVLSRHHRGLVALSACFWGSLPQACLRGGVSAGRRELYRYLDLFGRDFHPELQRHGIPDEEKATRMLLELSRRCRLDPVVSNDCHYRLREDWRVHDALIKTRFGRPTSFSLAARDYFLRDERQMARLGFPRRFLVNSYEVAASCSVPEEDLLPKAEGFVPEAKGERVYLGRVVRISPVRALADAGMVLGRPPSELAALLELAKKEGGGIWRSLSSRDPELFHLARGLEGATRRSVPVPERSSRLSSTNLRHLVPLKLSRGKIIFQYPPEDIESAPGYLE